MQLRKEAPYHIVFPAMHLTRGEISDLFTKELGSAPTDSPEELTMIARRALRHKYITADVGITGANFAIAETGMISITENEGNARLTAALPKTMITLVGIEKILPRMEDLALFLPMLATAGAGQTITGYNTMYGGPRQPGESDGPEEYHVVLLDNRRTELLADPEQRDALHCIRCGACLNVCPIYRNVGGHTYGTTYSGPIGSVITPHLRGLQDWRHLSYASSLCGACTETCPVKINLHHHLLQNRRNSMQQQPNAPEKLAFSAFSYVANSPFLWSLITKGRASAPNFPSPRKRWKAGSRQSVDANEGTASGRQTEFQRILEEPPVMMTEKEKILGRIREALKVSAPKPGTHDHGSIPHPSPALQHGGPVASPDPRTTIRQWLPLVGETFEEQVAAFRNCSLELKTDFRLLGSQTELEKTLLTLRDEEQWKRIATHDGSLTTSACPRLGLPTLRADKPYNVNELEVCDAGITECDALVAQTGTVVVTNRSAGGRALSVLPPHHVVLARREQFVRDLPAALALVKQRYAPTFPSMISFVTGPSRTGDIERILVLGAHGPKKLTVLVY